jgi:hypothetical protein
MEGVLGADAATTALLFRVMDSNNYYRLAPDVNGFYALRKVVNGVLQPLQFGFTRAQVTPSPGDRVRIVTRPDDGVFVAINDQQILDFGDPQFMFETGWGLASIGAAASVDEFTVSPRMEGYPTLDNFDQPDGSLLTRPTAGSKYHWQTELGSAWVATTGRARPTSTGYTYVWVDTSTEQATVEAKLVQQGLGAWVIFRFDELTNTYFRFGQSMGAYQVEFMNHDVTGTMPVAVQALGAPVPQAGDVIRVHQHPDGTVECSVNGVVTHRFVDNTTNVKWTLNGLAAQGSQAAFDDFRVTPFTR